MTAPEMIRSRLRPQLLLAGLCGAGIGGVQGVVEGLLVARRFDNALLPPGDMATETHVFWLLRGLFRAIDGVSLPPMLDVYLGPALPDKLPMLGVLVLAYVSAGTVAGFLVALTAHVGGRRTGIAPSGERALAISVLGLAALALFFNAACMLNGPGFETQSLFGLVANAGLAASALLFFAGWVWLARHEPAFLALEGFGRRISEHALGLATVVGVITLAAGIAARLPPRTLDPSEMPRGAASGVLGGDRDVNVVLISIDSLRADHLGVYGYPRNTSPNIDALARQGTVFTGALSTTSWTLPSHASMLTSMYPDALGVTRASDHLGASHLTLAEMLRDVGHATGAVATAPFLSSAFGFDQGFDDYNDFGVGATGHADSHKGATSPRVHDAAVKWLEANHHRRFFLFVHYWDVHYDYAPPPPFDQMFDPDYSGSVDSTAFELNSSISLEMEPRDLEHIVALYDGEIAYTDLYIGKLIDSLERLGVLDDTLIVLTADHGEEFFEHGNKGHVNTLYGEVLRVPLIVRFPDGEARPGIVNEPVSIIDIVPTVLEAVGIPQPESVQGRSLVGLAIAEEDARRPPIYASLKRDLASVESSDGKLIYSFESRRWEFYDLARDPTETQNLMDLADSAPIEVERYQELLLGWLNEQRALRRLRIDSGDREETKLSESMQRELRALGYIE